MNEYNCENKLFYFVEMYGNTNLFFGLGFDRMNIRLMDETNEMKKKTKLFLNGGLIILSAGFYRFRIDLLCVSVCTFGGNKATTN